MLKCPFQMEMQPFAAYLPDPEALAGADSADTYLDQTTRRLAQQVGAEVVEIPGRHAGYADHPHEVAAVLRPLLKRMS